ncbi:MAG TPA: hypothetical protein P5526_20555 [Anaerolineae bacterium]|nr:hypothetical protein [Anaerolineae bacterium]
MQIIHIAHWVVLLLGEQKDTHQTLPCWAMALKYERRYDIRCRR